MVGFYEDMGVRTGKETIHLVVYILHVLMQKIIHLILDVVMKVVHMKNIGYIQR